jgi:hypothetical protein
LIAIVAPLLGLDAQTSADGQRDFDWEIGRWRTQLLVRAPLDSAAAWVEYVGTSVVTRVMDGRANLVELDVSGLAGRIEGISLRLFNPSTQQWSLNFASAQGGTLFPPVYGAFSAGRGDFVGLDEHAGRKVLVRFVITPVAVDTVRFEQFYSDDQGQQWIPNWIATDTRLP